MSRASIVGAGVTHVGNVREHNEDMHFLDPDSGVFIVCDGMGGHAAGEVASAMAVKVVRASWTSERVAQLGDAWASLGTAEARRALLGALRDGVNEAHAAILAEARADDRKRGMGTTFVGAVIVGSDAIFAQSGDSRAYLVREGQALQLTEDHTLLSRLLAAGIDVDMNGDGARFKSMLTNALGVGDDPRTTSFVVPLIDGDRLLLCSDGVSEYISEIEVGQVLAAQPSPARAAQKLVELALERGGHDNATAVVLRVVEVGANSRASLQLRQDEDALEACPLLSSLNAQKRLRALRIAVDRELAVAERVPAHALGDRVAWIILEGTVEREGRLAGPGALLYPDSLIADRPGVARDHQWVVKKDLRAAVIRYNDFRELCEDDAELSELLLDGLAGAVALAPVPTTAARTESPESASDGVPVIADESR